MASLEIRKEQSVQAIAQHTGVTESALRKANPQLRKRETVTSGEAVTMPPGWDGRNTFQNGEASPSGASAQSSPDSAAQQGGSPGATGGLPPSSGPVQGWSGGSSYDGGESPSAAPGSGSGSGGASPAAGSGSASGSREPDIVIGDDGRMRVNNPSPAAWDFAVRQQLAAGPGLDAPADPTSPSSSNLPGLRDLTPEQWQGLAGVEGDGRVTPPVDPGDLARVNNHPAMQGSEPFTAYPGREYFPPPLAQRADRAEARAARKGSDWSLERYRELFALAKVNQFKGTAAEPWSIAALGADRSNRSGGARFPGTHPDFVGKQNGSAWVGPNDVGDVKGVNNKAGVYRDSRRQAGAQRAAAQERGGQRVVVLHSERGLKNGVPQVAPDAKAGANNRVLYADKDSGKVTHEWNNQKGQWEPAQRHRGKWTSSDPAQGRGGQGGPEGGNGPHGPDGHGGYGGSTGEGQSGGSRPPPSGPRNGPSGGGAAAGEGAPHGGAAARGGSSGGSESSRVQPRRSTAGSGAQGSGEPSGSGGARAQPASGRADSGRGTTGAAGASPSAARGAATAPATRRSPGAGGSSSAESSSGRGNRNLLSRNGPVARGAGKLLRGAGRAGTVMGAASLYPSGASMVQSWRDVARNGTGQGRLNTAVNRTSFFTSLALNTGRGAAQMAREASTYRSARNTARALLSQAPGARSAAVNAASRQAARRVVAGRGARSVAQAMKPALANGAKSAAAPMAEQVVRSAPRALGRAAGRFVPGVNIAIAAADTVTCATTWRDPNASAGKKIASTVTMVGSWAAASNVPVVSTVGAGISTVSSWVGSFF